VTGCRVVREGSEDGVDPGWPDVRSGRLRPVSSIDAQTPTQA